MTDRHHLLNEYLIGAISSSLITCRIQVEILCWRQDPVASSLQLPTPKECPDSGGEAPGSLGDDGPVSLSGHCPVGCTVASWDLLLEMPSLAFLSVLSVDSLGKDSCLLVLGLISGVSFSGSDHCGMVASGLFTKYI